MKRHFPRISRLVTVAIVCLPLAAPALARNGYDFSLIAASGGPIAYVRDAHINNRDARINNRGEVAFAAGLTDGSATIFPSEGDGGPLTMIAAGFTLPFVGAPGATLYRNAINDAGAATFVTGDYHSLYVGSGGTLTLIAGPTRNERYPRFYGGAINNSGKAAPGA